MLNEIEQQKLLDAFRKIMPEYDFYFSTLTKRNDQTEQVVCISTDPNSPAEDGAPLFSPERYAGLSYTQMALYFKNLLYSFSDEASQLFRNTLLSRKYVLEHVKPLLCNKEKNTKFLEQHPYTEAADLAVSYFVEIPHDDNSILVCHITHKVLDYFHLNPEQLKKAAFQNIWAEMDVRYLVEQVDSIATHQDCPNHAEAILQELKDGKVWDSIILTTKDNHYGAAVVLCEEFKQYCKQDMVVLPSSIHETLLFPAKGINLKRIQELVTEINTYDVSDDDYLSNNVYLFHAKTQKVELACDQYGLVPICDDTEIKLTESKHKAR